MNLYRIRQTANNNYDTFDSAVVVAKSIEAARLIQPSKTSRGYGWVQPEDVTVDYLGIATDNLSEGTVICASFNAG